VAEHLTNLLMVKVKVIKMLVVIARKKLISIKHQKLTMLVGVFLLKNPAAMVTVLARTKGIGNKNEI